MINCEGSGTLLEKTIMFFKVILIGDCNVGKSSIIRRLTRNQFSIERVPTIAIDEVTNFLMPVKQPQQTTVNNYSNTSALINSNTSQLQTGGQVLMPSPELGGPSKMQIIGLEIWDTLGQERHSSLVSSYYKNSSGIVIVYDVTNMESFLNV